MIGDAPWQRPLRAPLEALHRYWMAKAAGRPMPGRPDIDPVDIPALLPHVFLVDVRGPAGAGVFRLVGGELVELFGRNVAGRGFDDVASGETLAALVAMRDFVVARAAPVAGRCRFDDADGRSVLVDLVMLPLGTPDGGVEKILGGTVVGSWCVREEEPSLRAGPLGT